MWHSKLIFVFVWVALEPGCGSIGTRAPVASKLHEIKSSLQHRLRPQREDVKPNFAITSLNETLATKLANMRLGNAVRSRRDENDARKSIQSAEVKAAVAAVQAQEAKESALQAVKENEKAEVDIDNLQQKMDTIKAQQSQSVSLSSASSRSKGDKIAISEKGKDIDRYEKVEKDEDYEDYEDGGKENNNVDEKEAVETIVEDDVVTVKTTLIESDDDEGKGKDLTRPDKTSGNSDMGVCQGLLDLKSMSDDFRQRLQTLIDREERAVERLEQLENSFSQMLQKNSQSRVNSITSSESDGNIQPSKACVYIQEKIETGNAGAESVNTNTQMFDSNAFENLPQPPLLGNSNENSNSNAAGKIHIYTPEGVLPQNSIPPSPVESQAPGEEPHQFSNRLPILQARLAYPRQERKLLPNSVLTNPKFKDTKYTNTNKQSRLLLTSRDAVASKRKKARESGTFESTGDDGALEPEIDLENIYWIKTEGRDLIRQAAMAGNQNTNYDPKLQSVLKEIQDDGLDLLIIPISSKFDNVQDVAKSFLSSMRAKTRLEKDKDVKKEKRVQFRMTVRRVK